MTIQKARTTSLRDWGMVIALFSVIFSGLAGLVGWFKSELREHSTLPIHSGAPATAKAAVIRHEERRLENAHPGAATQSQLAIELGAIKSELKTITEKQKEILARLRRRTR